MEIHPIQKPQNKTILCHCWECPAVWLWDLDHYCKNRKSFGWVLHNNATICFKCGLKNTHDEWRIVRWHSSNYNKNQSKTTNICRTLEGCIASKLVTWRPTQGARSKGRPKKTYIDLLEDDKGYAVNEDENSMKDRHLWRAIINARQQESTEWVSEEKEFEF